MSTDRKAGPETDLAVAKAVGDRGKHYWMASSDGGQSLCASTLDSDCWPTKSSLESWLNERHAAGTHAEYRIVEGWLPKHYSTDMNDAMEAAEKVGLFMRDTQDGPGTNLSLFQGGGRFWWITNGNRRPVVQFSAPTPELAICEAVLAMAEKAVEAAGGKDG